jgi:hypothetical protein
MARLAALVPPPRMHLTRYHGVFAPHSKLRAAITPAGRGKGGENTKEGAQPRASGARMRRGRAGARADRRAGATAAGRAAVTLSEGVCRPDQPGSRADRAVLQAGIDTRRAVAQWTSAVRRRP